MNTRVEGEGVDGKGRVRRIAINGLRQTSSLGGSNAAHLSIFTVS